MYESLTYILFFLEEESVMQDKKAFFRKNQFGLMVTGVHCVFCGHPLVFLDEEDFGKKRTFCLHCDVCSFETDDPKCPLSEEERNRRQSLL